MATPKRRVAVTLPASPFVKHTVERMRWAEENGYTDGWFADASAPDSLTMIAGTANVTKRLRIGIAVTPVYSRTPAVLAATVNTIGQLLPGRFVMGVGSSSQTIMDGWHGIPLEKPVTRVRETVVMMRSMLKGEKSDFSLTTLRSHGYRQAPMENPPPIYIAALQPKMIEMAAEYGDGVIFNLWPKSALKKMIEHVHIGAKRAGKNGKDVEVVNRSMILVTNDKKAARDKFRAAFAPYYATPVYNNFLAWSGFDGAAGTIKEGWAAKDRNKTTAALTDELIDQIAIIGDEDECRARMKSDCDDGIHTHIVAPLAGATPEEVQRTFQAFTPDRFNIG